MHAFCRINHVAAVVKLLKQGSADYAALNKVFIITDEAQVFEHGRDLYTK